MVKIVTDSAGDIPLRLAQNLDISIVPARILFGRRSFKDGVNLNTNEFYKLLKTSYYHPNTTQASPLDFYRAFRRIEQLGEDILCISLPDSLSALIRSAREAAEFIEDVSIRVFNSGGVSTQQGLLVMNAANMAKAGFSLDEIVSQLREQKENSRMYAVAATLDYLKRGGRISGASYRVGSLLRVLPIVTIENEEVVSNDRQLFGNLDAAVDKILGKLQKQFTTDQPLNCFIMHAQNISGAAMFADKMLQTFNIESLTTTRIGATIGANIGPGALGVAVSPVVPFLA